MSVFYRYGPLFCAGGKNTFESILNMFEMYPVKVLLQALKPYALSPVPNTHPAPKKSFAASATGLTSVPALGLLLEGVTGDTNAALVFRTWGLMKTESSLQKEFYGPNFTYREFMKAPNVLLGILTHYTLSISTALLLLSPFRALMRKFIAKPGDGPDKEAAKKDRVEFKAVAKPDLDTKTTKHAFGTLSYTGSMYYCKSSLGFSL